MSRLLEQSANCFSQTQRDLKLVSKSSNSNKFTFTLDLAHQYQQLVFHCYQLECQVNDLHVWTHSIIIPQHWRVTIIEHIKPIYKKLKFRLDGLAQLTHLLLPPFDMTDIRYFEKQILFTEKIRFQLHFALEECVKKANDGEKFLASSVIQLAAKRYLFKVLTL